MVNNYNHHKGMWSKANENYVNGLMNCIFGMLLNSSSPRALNSDYLVGCHLQISVCYIQINSVCCSRTLGHPDCRGRVQTIHLPTTERSSQLSQNDCSQLLLLRRQPWLQGETS